MQQEVQCIPFFTTQLTIIISFLWSLNLTGFKMVLGNATLAILLFLLTPRDQNVLLKSLSKTIGRLCWSSTFVWSMDWLVTNTIKETSGFYSELSAQYAAASFGLLIGLVVCTTRER